MLGKGRDGLVPPAGHDMVIDHADRLHEGIDDGRAAELEAALFQVLGDFGGKRRFGGKLILAAKLILDRRAIDEIPEIMAEAALILQGKKSLRRGDRGFDLGAIADDAFILHQGGELGRFVARNLAGIEMVEGFAETFAPPQDRDPGKTGLKTVEDEFLEERPVVVLRHTPFLVVIGEIERVSAGPDAARLAVGMRNMSS